MFLVILGTTWLRSHDPTIHWKQGVVGMTCTFKSCGLSKTRPPTSFERPAWPQVTMEMPYDNDMQVTTETPYVQNYMAEPVNMPNDNNMTEPMPNNVSMNMTTNTNQEIVVATEIATTQVTLHEVNLITFSPPGSPRSVASTDSGWRIHYGYPNNSWYNGNDESGVFSPFWSPEGSVVDKADIEYEELPSPMSMDTPDLITFDNNTLRPPPQNTPHNFITDMSNSLYQFSFTLDNMSNEINGFYDNYSFSLPLACSVMNGADDKKLVKPEPELPAKYVEFESVFSKAETDRLQPHRVYDHKITLKPDSEIPFGPIYNLSKLELDTLQEFIKENLEKGFIRRSTSSATAAGRIVTFPLHYEQGRN